MQKDIRLLVGWNAAAAAVISNKRWLKSDYQQSDFQSTNYQSLIIHIYERYFRINSIWRFWFTNDKRDVNYSFNTSRLSNIR